MIRFESFGSIHNGIASVTYCNYCEKDLTPDCLKDAGGKGFCNQECYDAVHNPPHECSQWYTSTGCCVQCGEKTLDDGDLGDPYEPDDLAEDIANDMV